MLDIVKQVVRRMVGDVRQQVAFGLLLSATVVVGCASVKVTDEKGRDEGIEFYPAKPYLVLEQTKEGRKPTLISLPDVSRPRYLRHKGGWGTLDFSFVLTNGMLTTFNQKTDSKGPETIAAVGTLASGIGAAAAGLAPGAPPTLTRKTIQDLAAQLRTEVVDKISPLAEPLRSIARRVAVQQAALVREGTVTLVAGTDLPTLLANSDNRIRTIVKLIEPELVLMQKISAKPAASAVVVVATQELEQVLAKIRSEVTETKVSIYEIVAGPKGKIEFNRIILPD